jgi:iron complex outermembrane receptor protein
MSGSNEPFRYFAVLVAILFAGGAIATQQEDLYVEELYYAELPVVLHATRLNQAVEETPVAITIIDREMIEASSANTIQELLRYVPGFQLNMKSGSRLVTAFHGLEDDYSRRVQVLVNGGAIYDQAFGGIAWSALPITLDDIERIEVVRGPNVAAFGSGAFLGSINLVTFNPAESSGTSMRVDTGTDNRLGVSMRHAGKNDSFEYLVSAFYKENSGLPGQQDDMQAAHVNLAGNWRLNTSDSLEFGLAYREAKEQWGFADDAFDPLRERTASSSYAHIGWRRINAADDEWRVSLYRNLFDSDDEIERPDEFAPTRCSPPGLDGSPTHTEPDPAVTGLKLQPLKGPDVNCDLVAERYDLEIQNIRRLNEAFRLVWGAGARYDMIISSGVVANDEATSTQWRLFTNAEWSLTPSLLINVGLMYENPEAIDAHLSSRIGLNYRVNMDHSLRAAASRAWRTSFFENYANLGVWWGDGLSLGEDTTLPALLDELGEDPERLDAFEIGYLGQFRDQHLVVDVRLFHNAFNNFLHIVTDEEEIHANLYAFEYTGVEAQIRYTGEYDSLHLGYGYTAIKRSGASEIIDAMPEHTFNLLYTYRFADDWLGSISLFYVDELNWLDDAGASDAVAWADFKLAKTIRMENSKLDLALTAQNIFDEPSVTLRSESRGERRLFATLSYRF